MAKNGRDLSATANEKLRAPSCRIGARMFRIGAGAISARGAAAGPAAGRNPPPPNSYSKNDELTLRQSARR